VRSQLVKGQDMFGGCSGSAKRPLRKLGRAGVYHHVYNADAQVFSAEAETFEEPPGSSS